MMSSDSTQHGFYDYKPSHVLPAVFSALVGVSFLLHIYQNFRYRYWRVMFFQCWGGAVFTTGWVLRTISSYIPENRNVYIAQYVFIFAGPPIYAASEYNIAGRLLHYLPMHAPMNPDRVLYFFIYLGAAVESFTGAGAAMSVTAKPGDTSSISTGATLIKVSLILQAVVECIFISLIALMQHRCSKNRMLSRNVRTLCIMLYGTSTLILLRCIFRAIEAFGTYDVTQCGSLCHYLISHEWYLYAFEAAPMVIYTYWLNIIHPGRFLPHDAKRYLDTDGQTERLGPGWTDKRSKWETFADPFDLGGLVKGEANYKKFWFTPEEWPIAPDGSFAQGTATNVRNKGYSSVARHNGIDLERK